MICFIGARNSSQVVDFFTKGRQEKLDVYYISQSSFGLPRQSIRNNSDRFTLFKRTLRDIQSMYYDVEACDMLFLKFKEMSRKRWSEKFNYLCTDLIKKENEVKHRIFNESKNTYNESFCKKRSFLKTKDSYSHKYSHMCNYEKSIPWLTQIKVWIKLYLHL